MIINYSQKTFTSEERAYIIESIKDAPKTHLPIICILNSQKMKFNNGKYKFLFPKTHTIKDVIEILKNQLSNINPLDILEIRVKEYYSEKVVLLDTLSFSIYDIFNKYHHREFNILILYLERWTIGKYIKSFFNY